MQEIDKLIEKYFEAQTTLKEENELKKYFMSGEVKPEHQVYMSLFKTFKAEKEVKYPEEYEFSADSNPIKVLFFKKNWITISGIAATVLLCIWGLQMFMPQNNYAVINGKRYEDQAYVRQLANAKILQVNKVLSKNMASLKIIGEVHSDLDPIRRLSGLGVSAGVQIKK